MTDNRGAGARTEVACAAWICAACAGARRAHDDPRACRTVTREELVEYAHADLTGAQAPA